MLEETDLKQNEIAEAVGVSNTLVHYIIKELGIERDTDITLIRKIKGKGLLDEKGFYR